MTHMWTVEVVFISFPKQTNVKATIADYFSIVSSNLFQSMYEHVSMETIDYDKNCPHRYKF